MFYKFFRSLIFLLKPESAHNIVRFLLRYLPGWVFNFLKKPKYDPVTLFGLEFPNRIGLAAGWDKDGDCIDALFRVGFGFVEVGTVTPKPQSGNPKPRLFRVNKAEAIINRMGFNNKGVDALVSRLKQRKIPGILGVNIGKNKDTPNEQAHEDYLICLKKVYEYADYIVINISSPNTVGLRKLQSDEFLEHLLDLIMAEHARLVERFGFYRPLLLKLSPDYPKELLEVFLDSLIKHNVDGVIACNTTLDHTLVAGMPNADQQGGLSGPPVREKSTNRIREIKAYAGDKLPIIGVGGIDSHEAIVSKLHAGASLVQVYTGLIYHGRFFV